MTTHLFRSALAGLLLAGALPLAAQTPAAADTLAQRGGVRLFLDCSGFYCDGAFYRTEIAFVDHVRDRQDADVHLLITPQQTGGGGTEYTLNFVGRRAFAGQTDTLRYVSPPAASEDQRRQGLAHAIRLGLVPYVADTPVAGRLRVVYEEPRGAETRKESARDPWDHWTFRTRVSGFFNGESRVSFRSLFGSLSASRVTEGWKTQISANVSERSNRFEIDETTTVESEQSSRGLNGLVVRSLGPHWSAGARSTTASSTFLNQDQHFRFAPAVEYNVFPYSESTRRQLTFQYSVGVNSFDYREETIFGETAQTLTDHNLLASLDLKQRWGSVNVSAEGAQYLQEPSRYRGELFSDLDVRLVRGLSLNLFGSLSYIRDQIYLPAGNATPEEILLRLRQLDTSYRYFASVGVSYTFGSIYNNVVNPRFGAGRGGIMIMN